MSREQDFINRVVPACRASALKYGYHIISVPVAQAILESGWGTCYLSQFNNILGIKAYNNEPYVEVTTTEFYNGKETQIVDKFVKYDSIEDCFNGYFEFLNRYKHYAGLKDCKTADEYITILSKHYATDPSYAEKLKRIINQYQLAYYDVLTDTSMYHVICGSFSMAVNAKNRAEKLKEAGYKTCYKFYHGNVRVQTGAYKSKANAEKEIEKLKEKGYSAFITDDAGIDIKL